MNNELQDQLDHVERLERENEKLREALKTINLDSLNIAIRCNFALGI